MSDHMLRFDGVAPDVDDDGGDAVVVIIVVNLNPVDVIHFICLFNMQQLLLKDIFQKQKQQEGHIISRLVPAAKATTQFNSTHLSTVDKDEQNEPQSELDSSAESEYIQCHKTQRERRSWPGQGTQNTT